MYALMVLICAAEISYSEKYEANWESLDKRPIPAWFQDAKFGIFIHWGVYSVPAWAPKGQYAEWYWNHMKTGVNGQPSAADAEKSQTWKYHVKTYGEDFLYGDFAPLFKAQLFDAAQWAEVFKKSGAKYVVLTSKHHDGYCLWPSKEANKSWGRPWNSVDVGSGRDLLGELSDSVRASGLKMGFYYSMYEWYNPLWLTDKKMYIEKHMIPQFKDVVSKYKPAVIFSDGEWDMPSSEWRSEEILAWLYNETEVKDEVVINDRWGKESRHKHGDYYTTEYATGMKDAGHAWEENRGMGHSYGYNINEPLDEYRSSRDLVCLFVDMVSRGGNLLLDIGPTGDGRIPVIMEERLVDIGRWLDVNGEAIYGTRPWTKSCQWSEGEKKTIEYGGTYMVKYDISEVTGDRKDGKAVIDAFFTFKDSTLFAITPRWPGSELVINDIKVSDDTKVVLLGVDGALKWSRKGTGIAVEVPEISSNTAITQRVMSFRITGVQ